MHPDDAQIIVNVSNPQDEVEWSRTKPYPRHDVYYPGTEELKPNEMRVIACGTGMPQPRLKQAAACFLVELGNGDKFVFDMGEGSFERLTALGIPLDQPPALASDQGHALLCTPNRGCCLEIPSGHGDDLKS